MLRWSKKHLGGRNTGVATQILSEEPPLSSPIAMGMS